MRTFIEKIKTDTAVKWLEYFVVAYLLASWGVNGVIYPLHYFRNATMQTKELALSECADGILIELPYQIKNKEKTECLSFQITASKRYTFSLKLVGISKTGETKEAEVKVWKGWNSVALGDLWNENVWKEILVPQSMVKAEELILESAGLSRYRRVDTGRMGYIFVSFLLLSALWEGVWWMKKRYAE